MEYPKVPRHCLLPVFPLRSAYIAHFDHTQRDDWSAQIEWVKRYAGQLSDYVVVTEQSIALVERIERETGKKVVPTMALDTRPEENESAVLPSEFSPNPAQTAWIEYLHQRINDWPWIVYANSGNQMDTNQGTHPLMKHLAASVQAWPEFADKFAYAPWDVALGGEAAGYIGKLDESPVLSHLLKCKSLVLVYMALQVLYPSLEAAIADGYNTGILWLHMQKHDKNWTPVEGRTAYPYPHFQAFCKKLGEHWRGGIEGRVQQPMTPISYGAIPRKEACCFSGIGYYTGAARHNLARLVDFGFTGACFFPPHDSGDEGKAQMDQYVTDVEAAP